VSVTDRSIAFRGERLRVWEKGQGETVGVLSGLGGATHWTEFLELLAAEHRVVVPSLPGFPGGGRAHARLDGVADWAAATLDVLDAAGLTGTDLVGLSFGGMLAAEAAAFCPPIARSLALVAPFGLFDDVAPVADVFAHLPREVPSLLCADATNGERHLAAPETEDAAEWHVTMARASDAAARLLWPIPDRGLATRLHRVRCPVLLVWGDRDRVVPPSYAARFATALGGPSAVEIVEGAGHLVDLDSPTKLAQLVSRFFGAQRKHDHA